jgi:predicted aspartyl protease
MSSTVLASPAISRVKFRLAGGAQPLVLVPVRVNEQGPFEFILDTGAGTSLLTPELAATLEIENTGSKQGHTAGGPVNVLLAKVDSLGVGEARREEIDIAITDLSQIGRTIGAKLDGDLGYNFLKHFRLTIDFRASELKLEDPRRIEHFGRPAIAEVAMRLAQPSKPLILVEAHVAGRGPFQFAVDTGTSTTAISPELAQELHLTARPIGAATTGGAQIAMTAARVPSMRLGRAEQRGVDVIIGEFLAVLSQVAGIKLDGIIGYNFLRNYKVVIDYPNELFRLE